MKHFLTALLLGITLIANAQTATLDSKKIYASIPELTKVEQLIEKDRKEQEEKINIKSKELQELEAATVHLIERDPKAKSATDSKEKYQKLFLETKNLQQELTNKHVEYKNLLYKPYYTSINAAIKSVATRKKYMQVVDIQEVPMLYIDPLSDITQDVINALK